MLHRVSKLLLHENGVLLCLASLLGHLMRMVMKAASTFFLLLFSRTYFFVFDKQPFYIYTRLLWLMAEAWAEDKCQRLSGCVSSSVAWLPGGNRIRLCKQLQRSLKVEWKECAEKGNDWFLISRLSNVLYIYICVSEPFLKRSPLAWHSAPNNIIPCSCTHFLCSFNSFETNLSFNLSKGSSVVVSLSAS